MLRTSRHRRYSHALGQVVTVAVTPVYDYACHQQGKEALAISVTASGGVRWRPSEPLCLSALYDADTRIGRQKAADAAVDFFDAAFAAGKIEPPTKER